MPTSDWYDDVEVTFTFDGKPWLRTGAITYRARTYELDGAHSGPPTHAGLAAAMSSMDAITPTVSRFTTFVLDELFESGRSALGGRGEQPFGLTDYFANRNDPVAAWTTIGRSILDFADAVDLPGWTEDGTLESEPTEWATVTAVAGQAEYAHAYYATADNTQVYGNFGFAYVSSPDVVWNEDGTIDADPSEGVIDPPFNSGLEGPIPPEEFPWNQLITSDGKTISVSGYITGYTVPAEAAREFTFFTPWIAVETVTVRLPRFRWITPGPDPDPEPTDNIRVVRQFPRDDGYGAGSASRIHPPPRRGRIVGGQE